MVGDHQAQQVGQGPEQVVEQGVGNNPRENRPPGEVAVGQPATGEGQQNVAGAIPRTGQGIHEDKVDIVQGRPQKRGRSMAQGDSTVTFEVPEGMTTNEFTRAVEQFLAISAQQQSFKDIPGPVNPQPARLIARPGRRVAERVATPANPTRGGFDGWEDDEVFESNSVMEVDKDGGAIKRLYGPSEFPQARPLVPGLEYSMLYDSSRVDVGKIMRVNQRREGALGTQVEPVQRSDEVFLKFTSGLKYDSSKENFNDFVRKVIEYAVGVGATEKMTKMGLYTTLYGPSHALVADMGPMQAEYIDLSLQEYVDRLQFRLGSITEGRIAKKTYKSRKQEPGEGPRTFFYQKFHWYKKAYPSELFDFNEFLEEFIKRLTNSHLQDYLTLHASTITNDRALMESLNQGVLYVLRQVDNRRIPKSEANGLVDTSDSPKKIETAKVSTLVPERSSSDEQGSTEAKVSVVSAESKNVKPLEPSLAKCYYCEQPGHFAKECFKKKNDLRAGKYKFKPAKVNEIYTSSSESSDSDTREICHLMKRGHINKKTGRRAVRALRTRRGKKVEQVDTNSSLTKEEDKTPDNTGEVTEQLRMLQVQMTDLQESVQNAFLGRGKKSPATKK